MSYGIDLDPWHNTLQAGNICHPTGMELEQHQQGTSFFVTVVVNGPGLALPALSSLTRSLQSLLRETEFQQRGTSRIDWLAADFICGCSEDTGHQRLAIELCCESNCQDLVDSLFSMLEGLRSGSFPEAGRWKAILSHVLVLARYVEQGMLREMWLSQSGGTPVYITGDTFRHASELIRELGV